MKNIFKILVYVLNTNTKELIYKSIYRRVYINERNLKPGGRIRSLKSQYIQSIASISKANQIITISETSLKQMYTKVFTRKYKQTIIVLILNYK